ncbi:MAG: DNA polymerase III subunit gamma/tau [Dehalococcoidia bacterium]
MTSQVFYRKWRPQTLAEVMGQQHVTQTLRNALSTGKVGHAYLFCGPRGTGKTSTGRILAKAVNCLNSDSPEPCNVCEMCKAISEGRALDLLEIDAASNRGIDEIRELREKINYSPNEAKYKVYIIDEVHMLTEAAFNALLKTLEEPPPHAIFVLATTEPHKVPLTVISRCQRFDFHRISQELTQERLAQICEKEGLSVDAAAIKMISRKAGGSLRDAENLLEQLVVGFGSSIEVHHLEDLLGISGDLPVQEMVESIFNGDLSTGLALINRVHGDGKDLKQLHRELMDYLRGLMLLKAGTEEAVDLPQEALESMKTLSSQVSMEDILKAIHLFGQLNFRLADHGPLPLEIALTEFTVDRGKPAKEVISPDEPTEERVEAKVEEPTPSRKVSPRPKEPEKKVEEASPKEVLEKEIPPLEEERVEGLEREAPVPSGEASSVGPSQESHRVSPEPISIDYFRSRWDELVQALKGMGSKGSLDAFLRSACEPVSLEGDTVVLGFYHTFHKEKIEDPKYRHLVERKLSEVFGGSYKIRCILTPRGQGSKVHQPSQGHMVRAAVEMGAEIVGEEELEKKEDT